MNRKIHYWKLRSVELQLGEKTLIMGILNVTPDSFSDGGKSTDPARALARALEHEEQGADIIDIGAESTSPGSRRISAEEEWRRLVPVLKRLRDKLTIPISLDTYKAETAERAFEYGVEIVNDPSGSHFRRGTREDCRQCQCWSHPEPHARHARNLGEAAAITGHDWFGSARSGGDR